MKHITRLTQSAPRRAEEWQEFVCIFNQFLADGLGAKGGASPFVSVIEGKCDLPTPS